MSEKSEYIERLVYNLNAGLISPEEYEALLDWYNSHDDKNVTIESSGTSEDSKSRMLAGLMSRIREERMRPKKRYALTRWIAAAAAVFIIVAGTWMLLKDSTSVEPLKIAKGIEPGGNKARLTLADGRTIELSSSQSGIIAGDRITYTNGSLVANTPATQSEGESAMLTLHTPRGGTYAITLPDGSQVWLNAASTLKYPARFTSGMRTVELEGEAYFDVKDFSRGHGEKIPFQVICKRQVVEVLGTRFNINVYPGQEPVRTTLAEGKVAVSDGRSRKVLSPGQQAVATTNRISVKDVNVYNYTAWREGKFSFDDKTFAETMSEIGRWYDLDIVYENGVPEEALFGDAYRNQNIHLVLRLLDVAGIEYQLDVAQRKLTIKGKKTEYESKIK